MRILYDSKLTRYKEPFGTLTPEQTCTLNIYIPASVKASGVRCVINHADGSFAQNVELTFQTAQGPYETFQGKFS